MSQTVYMFVSKHSNAKTYHLSRGCRTLKSSLKSKQSKAGYADDQPPIREITKQKAKRRGLRLCRVCDPNETIDMGTRDRSAYDALKRAAKSD